ncbi:MAG: iron-sulfur cluster repair di-iron protein [Phycisphaeraceae bacterium]|nr:iron-sulfur cluster repair di-iron protein [Phycisphaeraceae bacterium]
MPRIDASVPIGKIGADMPRSLAVFERFGLDYCCQGVRTLREACRMSNADLDEVLRALCEMTGEAAGSERDWASATMTELADHIERTHHAFARESFARLAVLVPKVAAHHGAAHPELHDLERVVARLREEMLDHMIREDRVLFPWLRRLDRKSEIHTGPPWSVRRPIDCMMHDHNEVGQMFREIKDLTNNFTPPDNACASFRAMVGLLRDLERDTHVHIHKENNILFPAGVRAEEARAGAVHGHAAESPN